MYDLVLNEVQKYVGMATQHQLESIDVSEELKALGEQQKEESEILNKDYNVHGFKEAEFKKGTTY